MSIESDEYLEHFGVKGMKWGVRKKEESSPRKQKASSDDKRQAKVDAIRNKAAQKQAILDELDTYGTKSPYMLKNYGPAMGIDSRAAEIKYNLLYGASRKNILLAEKNRVKNSRDALEDDAKLVEQGKMTRQQKMLIGWGVAAAVVGVGLGIAVVNDRRLDKLTDSIKGGAKIDYDQYLRKLSKTETSRLSGISEETFSKMGTADLHIPSGQVFHRISNDKEDVLRKQVYAAFKDDDVNRYKAVLPAFWEMWGRGSAAKGGFDVSMKAVTDIVSPSEKKRVQAFIDLMDTPIKGQELRDYGLFGPMVDVTKTGREWLGYDKESSPQDVGLKAYRDFALEWVKDTPLNSAYFDKLKAQGYNAIVDDNDAGKLSDAPMLIFDTTKSFQRLGAQRLTPEDITKARNSLTEIKNRG